MRRFAIIALLSAVALVPHITKAEAVNNQSEVIIITTNGETQSRFNPFKDDSGFAGGIALADLGGDGTDEIIVSAGKGQKPLVRVLRQDGSMIGEFLAYAETYQEGVTVAACDLTGDGVPEIITGTKHGGGPQVRVFNADGSWSGHHFFAYDQNFRGGVNVACGNVVPGIGNEIITAPGISGGAHVRVFAIDGTLKNEAFVTDAPANAGASVSIIDQNSDGTHEILARSLAYSNEPFISMTIGANGAIAQQAHASSFTDKTHGASAIMIGSDLVATNGAYVMPVIKKSSWATDVVLNDQPSVFETRLATNSAQTLIVALTLPSDLGANAEDQYIKIDISDQKLYAYENGILVNSFLVSTGKDGHNTPLGTTTVTDKLPVHTYTWSYGENDPRNYSLAGVKWNLRFRKHYYIHSAYWHNNFGRRVSHGCVNLNMENAEWIFNWANVGAVVEITP
jgi:lipoprotein-anchoring transpeptidase ErfK/SrfK